MTGAGYTHRPVLLAEAVAGLAVQPGALVIDATFGRGGHSAAILRAMGPEGRLLALDRDAAAVGSPEAMQLREDPRFELERANFSRLGALAESYGWSGRITGILFDLGVSSPQLDDAARGFSFLRNGPLDMRMDTDRGPTARDWLAVASEAELVAVLRDFGEERFARRIARAICQYRVQHGPLSMTTELADLIERVVPYREHGRHPATRSFQAIRIFLNGELTELEAGLRQAVEVLAPGGRLVVIAFHSLEDRIVKRFMRAEERGQPGPPRWPVSGSGRLRRIGKAVRPGPEEAESNPRARSAVLRIAERLPW